MEEFVVYKFDIDKESLKQKNIFISSNAVVQDGAILYFNSCIMGDSVIYSGSEIHNSSTIIDTVIRKNCKIYASKLDNCEIGENTIVGPFAVLSNCEILEGECRIANFVEAKNCVISKGVNIGSLSTVSNAEIGCNSLIGSGVIFSTSPENKIFIGDNVEIGSNCSLIAPLTVADDSYLAIGSVLNTDLDNNQYAITRNKLQITENSDKKAR